MRTRIAGWPAARRDRIVLANHPGDGERRANRVVGMIVHPRQAAPHRHDEIADVFVDHALLVVDAGTEQCEMVVEQVCRLLLGQVLGMGRELDDVAEHHRHVAPARAHRVLAEFHQPKDQAMRHVGAEPFQRAARLVEAVAGIVDLAQPRTAMERPVEFQAFDQFGGRGDGADRPRHAEPDQQRQQKGDRQRGRADDGAVGQTVEIAGRVLDREILAHQPGLALAAVTAQLAIDEHPAPSLGLDDVTEIAQCAIDLRIAHRRIPDPGQHGIVDFLDGGQRPLFGQAKAARIDQPAVGQHLVVVRPG